MTLKTSLKTYSTVQTLKLLFVVSYFSLFTILISSNILKNTLEPFSQISEQCTELNYKELKKITNFTEEDYKLTILACKTDRDLQKIIEYLIYIFNLIVYKFRYLYKKYPRLLYFLLLLILGLISRRLGLFKMLFKKFKQIFNSYKNFPKIINVMDPDFFITPQSSDKNPKDLSEYLKLIDIMDMLLKEIAHKININDEMAKDFPDKGILALKEFIYPDIKKLISLSREVQRILKTPTILNDEEAKYTLEKILFATMKTIEFYLNLPSYLRSFNLVSNTSTTYRF